MAGHKCLRVFLDIFQASCQVCQHQPRANSTQLGAPEPWRRPGCYSFRATSGPVMRSIRGKVEAMIPKEASSPPPTSR